MEHYKIEHFKPSILSLEIQEDLIKNKIIDKPYRLNQIINFIYKHKNYELNQITNLSLDLRNKLSSDYQVLAILEEKEQISKDGTIKYLFKLNDENYIESVLLKDKNNRATFCISTQSGCRMGCTFCKTGKMGFRRNLDYTEIISQILFLSCKIKSSFNIVFMGMGEPLDNFDNLIKSIEIIKNKKYFNMSLSRVTVSTCGIIDKINPLLEKFPSICLAVSINSLIQKNRENIMPISKKYPLDKLMNTLYYCNKIYNKRITLEYVIIEGFNTRKEDIDEFKKLKREIFLINIIPQNTEKRIDENMIRDFCNILKINRFNVTRRYRRGDDISADCGQLYWESNAI